MLKNFNWGQIVFLVAFYICGISWFGWYWFWVDL